MRDSTIGTITPAGISLDPIRLERSLWKHLISIDSPYSYSLLPFQIRFSGGGTIEQSEGSSRDRSDLEISHLEEMGPSGLEKGPKMSTFTNLARKFALSIVLSVARD